MLIKMQRMKNEKSYVNIFDYTCRDMCRVIWQCVTQSMIMICVVSGIKNESTRKFVCVCVT